MLLGVGVAISSVHSEAIETSATANTTVIDGSKLTNTTTTDTDMVIDGITYVVSKGAKKQSIGKDATNNFNTNDAIFIGKTGAYLYNKTELAGGISSFKVYSNKGASAKVSIGINFGTTQLSKYDSSDTSTYTQTLSSVDKVYDVTVPSGSTFFWLQITNENNAQIQIKIEYGTAKEIASFTSEGTLKKTSYLEAESFDPAGLTLKQNYTDGTFDDVTNEVVWTPNPLTVGTTSVVGTYGGNSITINGIEVIDSKYRVVFSSGDWDYTNKSASEKGVEFSWEGTASSNNDQIRVAKGATFTMKTTNGLLITNVVFTCAANGTSKNGPGCFSGDNYTASDGETGTWESSTGATTFTLTASKDQVRITKIIVTLIENTNPLIQISNKPTDNLEINDSGTLSYTIFNATNPLITWESSNENVVMIDEDSGYYTAMSSGVATITVSMLCDESSETYITDSFEIVVNYGAMSISDANALISSLEGTTVTADYYVTISGYITNLNGDNQDSGSEKMIVLSDKTADEEGGNTINVYGIYSSNALRKMAILNGKVTIKGKPAKYNGTGQLTSPSYSDYSDSARDFADMFVDKIKDICADANADNEASLFEVWSTLEEIYDSCDSYAKAKLAASSFTDTYANLATFAEKYDHIVAKYNLTNFVGRTTATSSRINPLAKVDNTTTIAIIVVISLTSLTAIGGYLFIRKHKEQ